MSDTRPAARRVEAGDAGVTVRFDDGPATFPWRWLRDHARDPESFHHIGHQRLVEPSVAAAAGRGEVIERDDRLVVTWPGGPTTEFDLDLLDSWRHNAAELYGPPGAPARPWSGAELAGRVVGLRFDEIADGDDGLRRALTGLGRDGVITVRDVPADVSATRRVLERFGYLRTTIFGELWEFGSDGALDDTASTTLEIRPHTDGTYSHDAPGLLGLHCLRYDATGGESLFVDGVAIADHVAVTDPAAFELLSTVEIPGQYVGDGTHLVARRPVLRHEPDGAGGERLVQVSYNHHDRAPFLLPEPTMTDLFDALALVDRLAGERDRQFETSLRPGDMVVFDNWRVLHGRRAFEGHRWLSGGYVNREDVDSTIRRLAQAGATGEDARRRNYAPAG